MSFVVLFFFFLDEDSAVYLHLKDKGHPFKTIVCVFWSEKTDGLKEEWKMPSIWNMEKQQSLRFHLPNSPGSFTETDISGACDKNSSHAEIVVES